MTPGGGRNGLSLQFHHPLLPEPSQVKVFVELCLELFEQRVVVVVRRVSTVLRGARVDVSVCC